MHQKPFWQGSDQTHWGCGRHLLGPFSCVWSREPQRTEKGHKEREETERREEDGEKGPWEGERFNNGTSFLPCELC